MGKGLAGIVVVLTLCAAPAFAEQVLVTVTGEVEFNQIGAPPLGNVVPGDPATLTFAVNSDNFTDSMNFPVRGYEIMQMSFTLELGGETLTLQDPFPDGMTPWFGIRNDDPAVDGFWTSTSIDFPVGVPISQTGIFDQFRNNYSVTYTGDTLDSFDILDALGTYDFTNLTVFNWSVDDGPFQPLFIIFEQMTLELLVVDSDGDGVPDEDDLCPDTVIPESVPLQRLGVNRWALVDDDLVFDTNPPAGNGPGFMFDTGDTGGCSCEQIIGEVGLGNGHGRFGCSNGIMLNWASAVAGAGYVVGLPGTSNGAPADGLRDVTPVPDGARGALSDRR